MAIVRAILDPNNPPKFTAEELARLDAMTDEEITRAAESDPDNPPLTGEEFERIHAIQLLRRIRTKLGLSQSELAERFHINLARLRDWEQGRHAPDSVALAYLRVIDHDPDTVQRALAKAAA